MDLIRLKGLMLDTENKIGQNKIRLQRAKEEVFQLTQQIKMQEQQSDRYMHQIQEALKEKM